MLRTPTSPFVLSATLIALGACTSPVTEEEPTPSATTIAVTQDASASAGAGTAVVEASIAAIASANTSETVATSTASVSVAAITPRAAATPFSFTASGSITVDFDAPAYDHPHLSGSVRYDWDGAAVVSEPLHTSGSADYTVTATWLTDGIYTDPHSGATATIAAGAAWTFEATFDWDWVSDALWSIDATGNLAVDDGTPWQHTVTRGEVARTTTTHGQRHEAVRFAKAGDTVTFTHSVVSDWHVVTSGIAGTHTVHWDRDGLDVIRIRVDGVTYGPYTRAQVLDLWHCLAW